MHQDGTVSDEPNDALVHSSLTSATWEDALRQYIEADGWGWTIRTSPLVEGGSPLNAAVVRWKRPPASPRRSRRVVVDTAGRVAYLPQRRRRRGDGLGLAPGRPRRTRARVDGSLPPERARARQWLCRAGCPHGDTGSADSLETHAGHDQRRRVDARTNERRGRSSRKCCPYQGGALESAGASTFSERRVTADGQRRLKGWVVTGPAQGRAPITWRWSRSPRGRGDYAVGSAGIVDRSGRRPWKVRAGASPRRRVLPGMSAA